MEPEKPILDYSSPQEEQARGRPLEDERRAALEAYNESTFGSRWPIASVLLSLVVFVLCGLLIFLLLPRGIARLCSGLALVGFMVWQGRRDGWSIFTRPSIRRPSRWW